MNKDLCRTCTTIVLVMNPFVLRRSRYRCGLFKVSIALLIGQGHGLRFPSRPRSRLISSYSQ